MTIDTEDPQEEDSEKEKPLLNTAKVFVGSIPKFVTDNQLKNHFSSFKANIVKVDIIKDKESGKSKGFGFITFSNRISAEAAIKQMAKTLLLNKYPIKVKEHQSKKVEKSTPHIHVPATPPYNTKQQFTVKLTCLPRSLTNEQLIERLRIFGELTEPPKIFEFKNRYALAQYSTLIAAKKAIHGLHKTVLDGYTINVSPKGGQFPQAPTPSFALGSQWTVSLDHVGSLVSAEELKTMVGVSGVKVERLTSPPSRVLLYLPSNEDAHNVVKRLNGKSLLGKAIQANVITSGRTVNEEVKIPFDHQHSVPTLAANTPYLQEIIPPSSMPFPPPSVTVPTSLQSSRITHPHPPGSESSLTLSPADWNRLMIAGPSGRMLYQDVIEPYKTNPGIHIREDMISRTIFFTGSPEAIASAYSRVTGEVYRELTIQDRWVAMYLISAIKE